MSEPFWRTKSLSEMTPREWESLCDGCGKCCLVLLEDEEDGSVWETQVACRLFDPGKRRCTDYAHRHARMPDCIRLTPETAGRLRWMPETCAYRLVARGEDLPAWHPLRTGDPGSTAAAGAATPPDLLREGDVPEADLWKKISIERVSARKK